MARPDLRSKIREIPDFPKPGIVFKDIMPLLADAEALETAVDDLAQWAGPLEIETWASAVDVDRAPATAPARTTKW